LTWVHKERLSESLVKRGILPVDISSEGYRQTRALLGERAEVRFAQSVKVGVVVNEKMAGICFPDVEGRLDFSRGFIGYNSSFQKWCHDLFDHAWSSSSKTWPVGLSRQEESAAAELSRAKVAASQLLVFTSGLTDVDHFHPGWNSARPTIAPPIFTSSSLPLSNFLVSSGFPNPLTSIFFGNCDHLIIAYVP